MKLFAALGAALVFTKGPVPENAAAWSNVLEIADWLGDAEFQLRALWGLWAYRIIGGEYRTALALAERFYQIAETNADPADLSIGDRIIGYVGVRIPRASANDDAKRRSTARGRA